MEPKLFVATKAFIKFNNKILIIKESDSYNEGTSAGKYDVVGGRIKPGQRFDQNLLREIKEETGLTVTIASPFFVDEWRPVVKGEQWQVVCTYFECSTSTDKVMLSRDHDDFKWIIPQEHNDFNLIKDIHPAFEAYIKKR